MNLRILAPSVLACVLLASACGGSESDPKEEPATGPVASVEVTPATATIFEAKTVKLRAIAKNAGGRELAGRAVTWRSLDEDVATVDAAGLVTGVVPGTANIEATVEDHKAVAKISVELAQVASVSIEPARTAMGLDQEIVFTAVAKDAEGGRLSDRAATWSSSDASIISIGVDGKAWAKALGEATIEATVDGVKGSLSLQVVEAVPARIELDPSTLTLAEAQTKTIAVTVFDADGGELDWRDIEWSSSDETVATADAAGVKGVRPGTAKIIATAGEATATANVTVTQAEVVSVEISTRNPTVAIGESGRIIASARSADGPVSRTLEWTSSNPEIATVDPVGRIAGKAWGSTTITATFESFSATVELETNVALTKLKAGGEHSCGLTPTSGRPICFGANGKHQLGTETTETKNGEPISKLPVAVNVPADLKFTDLAVGGRHTCAITTDGAAWCWGDNQFGQLGNGAAGGDEPNPVAVQMPASTKFSSLALGDDFSCAIAQVSGEVWCWGNDAEGRLGRNVALTGPANKPGKTIGNDKVKALSAGLAHACAVTESGDGMCWGRNDTNQVGAGAAAITSPQGIILGAGQSFKAIAAGSRHTCGLISTGDAWCWGSNDKFQVGVSATGTHSTPKQVTSTVKFESIIAGADFNCALAAQGPGVRQGDAYCWGGNGNNQQGSGAADHYTVDAVVSPVSFKALSAGLYHVCGMSITPEKGYCWGVADKGQLGRSNVNDYKPGKVDGQL